MSVAYNLSEYVRLNSAIVPVTNGYDPDSSDESVSLIQTGGTDNGSRGIKTDLTIQFMSRATDRVTAQKQIQAVYDLLANRFGIELPEVTVGGVVYPAVTVWQILPIQQPGYIGADQNKMHQWSVNFMVTVRR